MRKGFVYHIKEPGLHPGDDGKSLEAFNQKYGHTDDVESDSGKSVKNDGHTSEGTVSGSRGEAFLNRLS